MKLITYITHIYHFIAENKKQCGLQPIHYGSIAWFTDNKECDVIINPLNVICNYL